MIVTLKNVQEPVNKTVSLSFNMVQKQKVIARLS